MKYEIHYRSNRVAPVEHAIVEGRAAAYRFLKERADHHSPYEIIQHRKRYKESRRIDSGFVWHKNDGTVWLSHSSRVGDVWGMENDRLDDE